MKNFQLRLSRCDVGVCPGNRSRPEKDARHDVRSASGSSGRRSPSGPESPGSGPGGPSSGRQYEVRRQYSRTDSPRWLSRCERSRRWACSTPSSAPCRWCGMWGQMGREARGVWPHVRVGAATHRRPRRDDARDRRRLHVIEDLLVAVPPEFDVGEVPAVRARAPPPAEGVDPRARRPREHPHLAVRRVPHLRRACGHGVVGGAQDCRASRGTAGMGESPCKRAQTCSNSATVQRK